MHRISASACNRALQQTEAGSPRKSVGRQKPEDAVVPIAGGWGVGADVCNHRGSVEARACQEKHLKLSEPKKTKRCVEIKIIQAGFTDKEANLR